MKGTKPRKQLLKELFNSPSVIQFNINEVWETVSPSSFINDINWYREAHEFCKSISHGYDININKVCGIVAAFSPLKSWEKNKELAEEFIRNYGVGRPDLFNYHTGVQVTKAQFIFNSDCITDQCIADCLNGVKTVDFFWNILQPENEHNAVIDRHMMQIATSLNIEDVTTRQYKILVEQYRIFAEKQKLLPNEVQTILWCTFRKTKRRNYVS